MADDREAGKLKKTGQFKKTGEYKRTGQFKKTGQHKRTGQFKRTGQHKRTGEFKKTARAEKVGGRWRLGRSWPIALLALHGVVVGLLAGAAALAPPGLGALLRSGRPEGMLLVYAGFNLVRGVSLWRLRDFGRTLQNIASGLGVFTAAAALIGAQLPWIGGQPRLLALVGLLAHSAILVYIRQPGVKVRFVDRTQRSLVTAEEIALTTARWGKPVAVAALALLLAPIAFAGYAFWHWGERGGPTLEGHISAEAEARHRISLEPGSVDARFRLGAALVGQERNEEALEVYREIVKLDRRNPQAFRRLGECMERKGDLRAAARAYSNASELDTADGTHHLALALVHDKNGKKTKAASAFRRATMAFRRTLAKNPDDAVARDGLITCRAKLGMQDPVFERPLE